ncbi:hypothetical protein Q7P36_005808 [Cladosporium allicinum]
MVLPVRVLPIVDCQSDGDRSKWPTSLGGLMRNDNFILENLANNFWAKDLDQSTLGGPPSIATWRLSRLPDGYAGFEKARANEPKHVDKFVYGHPNGHFRSLKEFYPHFKHLMDFQGTAGCPCKLCTGNNRRASKGGAGSNTRSTSPAVSSSHLAPSQSQSQSRPAPAPPSSVNRPTAVPKLPQGRLSSPSPPRRPTAVPNLPQGRLSTPSPPPPPRKQADEDGTTDIFRTLLDELKTTDGVIDRKIVESMSPDWRVGNDLLKELLGEWSRLYRFVPRVGELVLFVRDLKPEEGLAWDSTLQTWRKTAPGVDHLLDRPQWEAGVVTQMPLQRVDESDLAAAPATKSNVVNSGFRIEPLSKFGGDDKSNSRQHRYVPLHGIRPLVYWQNCLFGLPEEEYHQTVSYALTATNTFCVLGRDRFKGVRDEVTGSEATIFCRGAYIGSELILTGDTVRLLPNPDEQKVDEVTDILVVTAIKLRLVNIDEAGNDDWDEGRPYTVCLHVSGKAFTLDRKRSFDGVGKLPIPPDSKLLPPGLQGYGQWYHVTDPQQSRARLEVPYTRIFSRVIESTAYESWFQTPDSAVQPFRKPAKTAELKRGAPGMWRAREYAYHNDPRIDKAAGKSWFWADTRTEALDLHEVNNRFVGPNDQTRTSEQMKAWRKALAALDGSKAGMAEYHAERLKREKESAKEKAELAVGSYGMVGAAVTLPDPTTSGSGTDGEPRADEDQEMVDAEEDDEEDEDKDRDENMGESVKQTVGGAVHATTNRDGLIELSDDDDEDEDVGGSLDAFRAGGRAGGPMKNELTIDISDDDLA